MCAAVHNLSFITPYRLRMRPSPTFCLLVGHTVSVSQLILYLSLNLQHMPTNIRIEMFVSVEDMCCDKRLAAHNLTSYLEDYVSYLFGVYTSAPY